MSELGARRRALHAVLAAPALAIAVLSLRGAQEAAPGTVAGRALDTDPAGAGVHSSCQPRLAATEKHLHVVWQDARDAEWAVRYRRGDASGASWDAQDVRLSPAGAHAVDPRVVAVDGCVHVVWRTVGTTRGRRGESLCATSSFDDGSTWSPPASISPDSSDPSDFVGAPDVAAIGSGGACVAWIASIGEEDHALVAVHHGRGSSWPQRPTVLTRATHGTRAALARVAGSRGHVGVSYVVRGSQAPAELVFRGSADEGDSFPDSLAVTLHRGTAATGLALAAGTNGVVHVVWPDVDSATGRAALLAQRSDGFGAPGSWLEGPVRVDDAGVPRSLFTDAGVAVDPGGNALVVFSASRPAGGDGSPPTIEIVANSSTVAAPGAETWTGERIVATARRRGPEPSMTANPRLRLLDDAGGTAAAVAWVADPLMNDAHARLWIGATVDGGSSWSVRALDAVTDANAPRADHPDLVLRRAADASVQAALVWDDRRFWTPPGIAAHSGSGAPETCFLSLVLPCAPPRSR